MVIKRRKKPKELVAGGMISAGVGIVTNLINADKQAQAQKKLEREQFENALTQRSTEDTKVLDTFPTSGTEQVELYENGGKLPPGNAERLAGNAKKVVNAGTHESGNDVPVLGADGSVQAKVEDQEVILDGEKVLSERSGHAQVAEEISSAKGAIEGVLNDKNLKTLGNREKNAAKRTLDPLQKAVAELDKANDSNFKTQEEAKLNTQDNTGEGDLATGGLIDSANNEDFKFDANKLTPYLDNIVALTQKTPDVPKPVLQEAAKLDTTVDVSADINDINKSEFEAGKAIDQATSNSNVALARKAALAGSAVDRRTGVRADARGEKRNLVNADRLNTQRVGEVNAAKEDEFATNTFQRSVAQNDKIMANINNAIGDARQSGLDDAMVARDDKATLAILSQNAGSGAYASLVDSGYFDDASDKVKDALLSGMEARGEDTKARRKLWNK